MWLQRNVRQWLWKCRAVQFCPLIQPNSQEAVALCSQSKAGLTGWRKLEATSMSHELLPPLPPNKARCLKINIRSGLEAANRPPCLEVGISRAGATIIPWRLRGCAWPGFVIMWSFPCCITALIRPSTPAPFSSWDQPCRSQRGSCSHLEATQVTRTFPCHDLKGKPLPSSSPSRTPSNSGQQGGFQA